VDKRQISPITDLSEPSAHRQYKSIGKDKVKRKVVPVLNEAPRHEGVFIGGMKV
jgi:hypothetical protein